MAKTRKQLRKIIFDDPVTENYHTKYTFPQNARNIPENDNRFVSQIIVVWVNQHETKIMEGRNMVLNHPLTDEHIFAIPPPNLYDAAARNNTVVTVTCVDDENPICNVHCVINGLKIN